ncbi:MAG: Mannitol operon repressor [Chloroflexi bacterium]|nr:Mannitol operon repressor [Chloroflexota bacterium]
MSKQSSTKSKKWKDLVNEFRSKSDRAVVILGAAYLKTHLGGLLESFFIDDPEISEILLGQESPLGSFSTRVKVAYSLGLLSPNEYRDLLVIQAIHKEFVGEIEEVKFTNDEIRELCFRLKIPREVLLPGETLTPRRLFVFATAFLAQQLMLRTSQAAREKRAPRENILLVDMK